MVVVSLLGAGWSGSGDNGTVCVSRGSEWFDLPHPDIEKAEREFSTEDKNESEGEETALPFPLTQCRRGVTGSKREESKAEDRGLATLLDPESSPETDEEHLGGMSGQEGKAEDRGWPTLLDPESSPMTDEEHLGGMSGQDEGLQGKSMNTTPAPPSREFWSSPAPPSPAIISQPTPPSPELGSQPPPPASASPPASPRFGPRASQSLNKTAALFAPSPHAVTGHSCMGASHVQDTRQQDRRLAVAVRPALTIAKTFSGPRSSQSWNTTPTPPSPEFWSSPAPPSPAIISQPTPPSPELGSQPPPPASASPRFEPRASQSLNKTAAIFAPSPHAVTGHRCMGASHVQDSRRQDRRLDVAVRPALTLAETSSDDAEVH
jgi:hypothetical protein